MAQTLVRARECLKDSGGKAQPVQDPVPVLIGAMSRAGLAVAAEPAEIIAFSGLRHKRGHPPGTLTAVTAEETDELVPTVREQTRGRPFESDVLLQAVELGEDPLAGAKDYIERDGDSEDPGILAESPCVLFARTAARSRRRD